VRGTKKFGKNKTRKKKTQKTFWGSSGPDVKVEELYWSKKSLCLLTKSLFLEEKMGAKPKALIAESSGW